MGLKENMHAALVAADAPVCDDCIWPLAGMTSRQQANARGRHLEELGVIRRGNGSCSVCGGYKTVSVPTDVELPVMVEDTSQNPWHWEGNVQAALVEYLTAEGWSILGTANTATKEAGVDVKALDPQGGEWWITVKGYPEKKPMKPTNPATQARHWFSHAMFDVVMYRTERQDIRIGVAFPSPFGTYERLATRSSWLHDNAPFTYFWVKESGIVDLT